MANVVTVHSMTTDETYNVKLVRVGERYGLSGALIAKVPLVEFYDQKYAGDVRFGPLGQFVTRYELSTLLDHNPAHGIDFVLGEPYWKIDAKALAEAISGLFRDPAMQEALP
jgi:hypothetical protein